MVWVLMFLVLNTSGVQSHTPGAVYQTERACQTANAKAQLKLPRKAADGSTIQSAQCVQVPMHAEK
jgi:hypothetical protein